MDTRTTADHPGVRSVKQQATGQVNFKGMQNAALTAVAVALVLLVAFFALSGTKVLDITALHPKGDTATSHVPLSDTTGQAQKPQQDTK